MLRRVGSLAALVILLSACSSGGSAPSSASAGAATATPAATPSPTEVPTPAPTPTLTWHAVQVPAIPAAAAVEAMVARTGPSPLFVAVGVSDWGLAAASAGGNDHLGDSWVSTDGITWQPGGSISTARVVWDVAYGAGRFVAVGGWSGEPGSGQVTLAAMATVYPPGVWTSPDGQQWEGSRLANGTDLMQVVYGDSGFVAVGSDPNCGQGCFAADHPQTPVYTSPDGLGWTAHVFNDGVISALAALPGAGYVAVGSVVNAACPDSESGEAWYSADGVEWTRALDDGTCAWTGPVIATETGYLGIGGSAASDSTPARTFSWTSADGRSWDTGPTLPGLGDGPVALGVARGIPVLATDAGIWELTAEGTLVASFDSPVPAGVFGGGEYLGVDSNGAVVVVPDPAG